MCTPLQSAVLYYSVGFFFFFADDESGGKKFGAESFGKFETLSVFARHGEAKNVNTASTEPLFDCFNFFFHIIIVA